MDDEQPEPPPVRTRGHPERGDAAPAPGPGERPAVVARDRKEVAARARWREWRRSLPSLLVALVLHGALGYWLHQQILQPLLDDGRLTLFAEAVELEPEEPLEELVEPEPELLPPPEPLADLIPETEIVDVPSRPVGEVDMLGLGGRGGGSSMTSSSVSSALGDGDGFGFGDGSGGEFREFVSDLRQRGLDVVFVVDATGSMQRFIDRAREAIDDIIGDLSSVVPDLRLGLVAYRDLQDEWVTKHVDLTRDRYRVQTFLLDLTAAGGRRETPDFEEAVEVGLALAKDGLAWREDARRVILLVGDAPYHDEDKALALATVRSFARDPQAVVNTVYVGAGDGSLPTRNQTRAREAWQVLARTGGGTAFELLADRPEADAELRQQVTEATFGAEWKDEVEAFLARAPHDTRLFSVRRHVLAADRKWLARRLRGEPLHPAVVAAALELFDPVVARTCLELLNDEAAPPVSRSAGLFVLKSRIAALAGVPFDTEQPLAAQAPALAVLRREVERLGPAQPAGRAVVAPRNQPGR